ncbi:MAG TPA: ATP-binding cassette domain-containing protein [Candidatus Coprenecus pullistercoris]|nr:ATP-binding cassette domain-containing protein [Candidatus Coprenecus pullistercoris]
MKRIELSGVVPEVFRDADDLSSGIWNKHVVFNKGKTYMIEAASGKGKSSLCSYLYGIRHDYIGTILFDGTDAATLTRTQWRSVRRSSASMMFQDLGLFNELTVMDNIMIKNSMSGQLTRTEILSMLEELGIGAKAPVRLSGLSWGEKQRVAFIRALAQPFDFIILDEPVSHLDMDNAEAMAGILSSEIRRRGAGAIVTSLGYTFPITYDETIAL